MTTTKRKPGRPAGSGIYTVRRQIVLTPELAQEWREMCSRIGGNESAHIRQAMSDYMHDFVMRMRIGRQLVESLDARVKSGRYPKPVKLGARTTAWRAEDIRALIESMRGEP